MSDIVDFRVDGRLAVGHDALQTIIFVVTGRKPMNGYPWFDGASWKATRFIHIKKSVLLRNLRELGWLGSPETCPTLRCMAEDLRHPPATGPIQHEGIEDSLAAQGPPP